MTPPSRLGELLRSHRVDASLTIEMLAERSTISDRTISDIERGISRAPQQRTLQALAQALDLDAEGARTLYRAARRGRELPSERATTIAPAAVPDFTGRQKEIAAVVDYLAPRDGVGDGVRIVVVCGSPGIGKTTTAMAALRRAAGTQRSLFVDLAGLDRLPLTPLQVLQSLLRQVAADSATMPRSLDAAAAAWRKATQEAPTVVLLDNAANEDQLRPVLASGRACAVIITSRRSLSGLEGALRVTLQPLDAVESIQLLRRIIPASQRTDAELTELARLCGDMPLALRIAGNRIASQPTWSTADFIARMRGEERRLRTLTAGDLGVEAAFASSYDNLEAVSQDLYRSLSLIEGSTFDARTASSIIPSDPLETEDLLDELTDLGLLEARGSIRYRLHDLARLFAADRFRTGVDITLRNRRRENLRLWLMASASRAGRWFEPTDPIRTVADHDGLSFPDMGAARQWLQAEADSWFAAYRQSAALADHEAVVMVADCLHWFSDLWVEWGHWHELFSHSADAAIALDDPATIAKHLGYLAWADIIELGDHARAERDATRAKEMADRSGDDSQRGWSRFYLSWARDGLGLFDEAIDDAQDALARFDAAGDRAGVLQSTALLAALYRKLGGADRAIAAHHALLRQIETNADSIPSNIALFTRSSAERRLAEEYLAMGRPGEAISWARSSLDAAETLGYSQGATENRIVLAHAHSQDGDMEAAWLQLDEAERLITSHALTTLTSKLDVARADLERRHPRRP